MFGEFLIQMARGLSGGKDNQIFSHCRLDFVLVSQITVFTRL